MLDQDYILLILNCGKYRFKALKQKDTWIPNLPKNIVYFHVLGDPELTNDFEFSLSENILYIKVDDDYNSLPKKVIRAYSAINKTYNFKYIFKTDDDQQVTNIKFFSILIHLLNNNYYKPNSRFHYGGRIVDVKQAHISQYYKIHPELPHNLIVNATQYCSGRFYFLSNDAIDQLIQKEKDISTEYFEDYAIGLNLSTQLKINMLLLDTDKYFIDFK
jgi:hypothetical protein